MARDAFRHGTGLPVILGRNPHSLILVWRSSDRPNLASSETEHGSQNMPRIAALAGRPGAKIKNVLDVPGAGLYI